jgi:hypothetical protein
MRGGIDRRPDVWNRSANAFVGEQPVRLPVKHSPDRILPDQLINKLGGRPEHVSLPRCPPDRHNPSPTSNNMGVILPDMNPNRESQPDAKNNTDLGGRIPDAALALVAFLAAGVWLFVSWRKGQAPDAESTPDDADASEDAVDPAR